MCSCILHNEETLTVLAGTIDVMFVKNLNNASFAKSNCQCECTRPLTLPRLLQVGSGALKQGREIQHMDIPFFRFPYFEIGNTVYCNLARILLGQGPLDLIFELPRRHDKRGAQKCPALFYGQWAGLAWLCATGFAPRLSLLIRLPLFAAVSLNFHKVRARNRLIDITQE